MLFQSNLQDRIDGRAVFLMFELLDPGEFRICGQRSARYQDVTKLATPELMGRQHDKHRLI